jgi:hypothetical protein
MRLFATILAVPGLFIGTISLMHWVDDPSWRDAEWTVVALGLAVFFGVIAVLGREP